MKSIDFVFRQPQFQHIYGHFYVPDSCIHSCIHSYIHSFIHSFRNLSVLPSFLHTVWSSSLIHPPFPSMSYSSCLRLLSRLPVTFLLPSNFPSITCFMKHILRQMWPIRIPFLLLIIYSIFLSISTPFLTRLVQLTSSNLLQNHISKFSMYWKVYTVKFVISNTRIRTKVENVVNSAGLNSQDVRQTTKLIHYSV